MSQLDIKDQLRIVRDKCPDIWQFISGENSDYCPSKFGFENNEEKVCMIIGCQECWNRILKGGK
jgi:hypothetical protein